MLCEEHCTYICIDMYVQVLNKQFPFYSTGGSTRECHSRKQIETLLVRTLFVNLNGGVRAKEARLLLNSNKYLEA